MLKEYALAPYPKPNEVNMGILLLVWFFFLVTGSDPYRNHNLSLNYKSVHLSVLL